MIQNVEDFAMLANNASITRSTRMVAGCMQNITVEIANVATESSTRDFSGGFLRSV